MRRWRTGSDGGGLLFGLVIVLSVIFMPRGLLRADPWDPAARAGISSQNVRHRL
jgi:hypothetical protein